jgi:hypothetical protein
MTELNYAYNLGNSQEAFENYDENYEPQPPMQQTKKPQQPPQLPPPQLPQLPIQPPQQTQEKFTNYQSDSRRYPEYSFWDRMVMSKREVLKLFILAIVIILGISIEKIGFHYLSNYINNTDLSGIQEFLVRLSFPILVFLLLWIIKSL